MVAVGATGLALLVGLGYGALAGWVGGRTDAWLMRGVDAIYALPDVLVTVLLIEVLSAALAGLPDLWRRLVALALALGFAGFVGVARLVRALVLQAREETWVEAARASGASPARILLRHVLPNIAAPRVRLGGLPDPRRDPRRVEPSRSSGSASSRRSRAGEHWRATALKQCARTRI